MSYLFFKGCLFMREEGEEAEMQRPEFLSEQTHIEENTLSWLYQNPRIAQIFSTPSTGTNLLIQQINSPLCRSCLVDAVNTLETRAPDLLFLMSLWICLWKCMTPCTEPNSWAHASGILPGPRGRGLSASSRPPLPSHLHTHKSCYHSENM